MTSAVRLNNGGVIEVRTGVLQGIGPQGPRGLQGIKGPSGDTGPQGETGPPGAITQYLSSTRVASSFPLTIDTDTLVAFGSVQFDDLGCFQSSTNIVPSEAGDYMFSVWLQFNLPANAGDGARAVFIKSGSTVIARAQQSAVIDDATYVSLNWVQRATAGTTFQIFARTGDDLSTTIGAGALTVCRVGSGPQGAVGPQGPQGNTGPAGAQGPAGPAGNAGSGYATYGAIHA